DISLLVELGHGEETLGRAGIADGEGHLARQRLALAKMEIPILGIKRLAILVDAQEADIQSIARGLEIIWIAAEIGDRILGREDDADILITPIFIEIVPAAAEQRLDIATQIVVAAGAVLGDRRRLDLQCRGEIGT